MRKPMAWRETPLLLVILPIVLAPSGCANTPHEPLTDLRESFQAWMSYGEGQRKYTARDYTGAIPLFQRALKLDPSFDDAEADLAWSYYHVGAYAQATRHFRQVLLREPKWEGLWDGLGWSRYRVERYHLALEAFQQALNLEPRYRDAAVGRAFSLFEMEHYAEALPDLQRLVHEGEGGGFQSPTKDVEDVRARLAWTLFYLKEYKEARDQFLRALSARPNSSGLVNGLGWSYLRLGDQARARASFERALRLRPNYADAREGLTLARR